MRRSVSSTILLACAAALAAEAPAQSAVRDQQPATAAAERDRRRSPVVDVFQRCRGAVVNISTTRVQQVRVLRRGSLWDSIFDFGVPFVQERAVRSVGSGVVIHEKGYIVTNAHVVAQTTDVRVSFADGRECEAQIVAIDQEHDLAVLKINTQASLPCVGLGRSDDIMVGETVVAIGNPLGLGHTVTAGIVSAVNRELKFSDEISYGGLIQTDAAINPGNSGGPLLNVNGELIGINTAIRGDAQNVGFAIPVDRLWELLPGMLDIERRQRVRFGLEVDAADARVLCVRPDSPAAEAGLRPGDRLLRFNKEALRNGIDYYVHLLEQKPGATIRLEYARGEDTHEARLALQPVPPPDGRRLAQELFGMDLAPIPEAVRRRARLPQDIGLIVTEVEDGGPAARVQIAPGDIILRIAGVTVRTLEEVGMLLEGVNRGQRVLIEGYDLREDYAWYTRLAARSRS